MGFKSFSSNIDTTSATGRLIFHIFASLSEFERNLIQERTNAGLASARARGKRGGRSNVLSGEKAKIASTLYNDKNNSVNSIY